MPKNNYQNKSNKKSTGQQKEKSAKNSRKNPGAKVSAQRQSPRHSHGMIPAWIIAALIFAVLAVVALRPTGPVNTYIHADEITIQPTVFLGKEIKIDTVSPAARSTHSAPPSKTDMSVQVEPAASPAELAPADARDASEKCAQARAERD